MPNKVIKYKDGSEYSGKVDDKGNRHDKGKLTLANGEKYVGEWKNDKKDGQGVYYNTDGSILKRGFWRDDIFLKKSEYFKIKDQKKLREKFSNLLQGYRNQMDEANYPYSDKANQYPEKHPFESAPSSLLDDEDFMLNCLEVDDAECFKFCSYRLRNKKDFVMSALNYTYPEYDNIGEKLKEDFDILKSLRVKDFSKYGHEILRNEKKLIELIKGANYEDFTSHQWLSIHGINKSKSFFLKLIDNDYNSELCLKWADNSLKKDYKFIYKCVSKNAKVIRYVNQNIPKFEKLVLKAIKKDGELLRFTGKKFLKNNKFILLAARSYGEIYKYISQSQRNDKKIALQCLLKDPQMLRFANTKIKADKKLIIKLIRKDFKCFKYIDKKLKLDSQILKTVILNTSFGSGDEYKIPATYLSKLGNRNLIKFAIKKSEWWFPDLSEKYRNDKEIALITVKKSDYQFKCVSEKLKKDNDILEAGAQNFLKVFKNKKTKKIENNNINDLDNSSVSLLHRDLFWYIFDKVNTHKLDKKEYAESDRIRGDMPFTDTDVVYYSGEMLQGRAHGKGYATNEESEWGDAAFPSTYNGQWLNGLPNGSGEFKQYSPNHFPPNGKTQDHYIGTFKDGMMDGKGKQYLYRVEDSKTKWRKVFYKKGKLIKYF